MIGKYKVRLSISHFNYIGITYYSNSKFKQWKSGIEGLKWWFRIRILKTYWIFLQKKNPNRPISVR